MQIPFEKITELISPRRIIGVAPKNITAVVRLDQPPANNAELFWCNDANLAQLELVAAGAVICGEAIGGNPPNKALTYLVVEKPRMAFAAVLREFFEEPPPTAKIESTARLDESVKVGKNVYVGHYVIIEAGCVIGDDTTIGSHTVIHRNTVIGKKVKIGSHNVIGSIGFGYEKDDAGQYQLIPHVGNVVIEDCVDIGANNCIDRAPLGSTRLCKNVKVDNFVHVAHGCIIRENSLLIAHSMIAGSVDLGPNVWVAPCASIKNGITVGDGALVGMGAVVVKPVAAHTVVAGNPARDIRKQKE